MNKKKIKELIGTANASKDLGAPDDWHKVFINVAQTAIAALERVEELEEELKQFKQSGARAQPL